MSIEVLFGVALFFALVFAISNYNGWRERRRLEIEIASLVQTANHRQDTINSLYAEIQILEKRMHPYKGN